MRVLVLALGNPILSDDGVAFHVLERLRRRLPPSNDLALEDAATGGIDLLPYMTGFERVLIIDAVKTRKVPPGTVRSFGVHDFRDSLHADSPHHTNLATAVELGRRMHPDEMPEEISILGIEVDNIVDFGEELTPAVEAAVEPTVDRVLDVLRSWGIAAGPEP